MPALLTVLLPGVVMDETELPRSQPRAESALRRAVHAALGEGVLDRLLSSVPAPQGVKPQGAAPRNTAPPVSRPNCKPDPPPPATARGNPKPLKAIQLTAARLLLEGKATGEVAKELGVHRWTVSRWQTDPRFQAELRRQVERAAQRHAAQQSAKR